MKKLSRVIQELQELFEKEGDIITLTCNSIGELYIDDGNSASKRAFELKAVDVERLSIIEQLFPEWCGSEHTVSELKPIKVALIYGGTKYVCDITDLDT